MTGGGRGPREKTTGHTYTVAIRSLQEDHERAEPYMALGLYLRRFRRITLLSKL